MILTDHFGQTFDRFFQNFFFLKAGLDMNVDYVLDKK